MGAPCARGRESWVKGCRWRDERDKIFTVWPVRGVNGNCQGRPVGHTGCPLAARSWSPKRCFSYKRYEMRSRLWNLIDIDHNSIVPSFSWYFQENERARFCIFMDLRKFHHLWLANNQSSVTIVTNRSIRSQRPKSKFYPIQIHFLSC